LLRLGLVRNQTSLMLPLSGTGNAAARLSAQSEPRLTRPVP